MGGNQRLLTPDSSWPWAPSSPGAWLLLEDRCRRVEDVAVGGRERRKKTEVQMHPALMDEMVDPGIGEVVEGQPVSPCWEWCRESHC